MPRATHQARWRRIAEQTIMWVILAATVGLAAVVDVRLNRLGEVQQIGEVSLRLPRGWQPIAEDSAAVIRLRERGDDSFVRTLTVRYDSGGFSLRDLLRERPANRTGESIRLKDGTDAQLRISRRALETQRGVSVYDLEIEAVVPTPSGRRLLIALQQLSLGGESDVSMNVSLLRRILETVRFD